jgi:dTDP-4-amino-4,6-dideoxygalactose transaminase
MLRSFIAQESRGVFQNVSSRHGTTDESVEPIPVLRPLLPSADRLLPYLRRIDAARVYSNFGPLTTELERRLADHIGINGLSVVTASSGTAALVAAILATAGRATSRRPYALIPAFTFVATASAVEQCGYEPLFADVSPASWHLLPDTVREHPERERIGIVVPVAPLGRPVELADWTAFQAHTGIPVVVDGAACFDSIEADPDRFIGETPLALSFHATKSFATGEGGCVLTTCSETARAVTRALNFGFYVSRNAEAPNINGKLSEYAAAVGLAELDGWSRKRAALRKVVDRYRHSAAGFESRLCMAPVVSAAYVLLLCNSLDESERVCEGMTDAHVGFRRWYGSGVHYQQHYARQSIQHLPVTEALGQRLLGLPVAPDLSDASIERICRVVAQRLDEIF